MTPELQSQITRWRARIADNTATEEEMIAAVRALRAERFGAQIASDSSRRKKAKVEVPSADDLLKELGIEP